MIKLIGRWLKRLLFDERVAAASLRSFITFLAATGGIVVASASDAVGGINVDIVRSWDLKAWLIRLGFASLFAGAARIRAGDRNLAPAEIRTIMNAGSSLRGASNTEGQP